MDPTFSAPPVPVISLEKTYASLLPTYLSPLGAVLDRLDKTRERLNLPDPGKAEELGREVKSTHLTNYTFDGARADLSKVISQDPAFQVTHSFATGSQGGPMGAASSGTYNFSAVYATNKTFMQGMVDNEGGIVGRYNYAWSPANTTKVSVQLGATSASPSMFSLEHDRTGKDYTLSLKTYNPSPADLTGTYLASYLQSVHPNFAVGVEAVYQYPSPDLVECALGYMAKWHSVTKNELTGQPAPDSWIATGQILSNGLWNGTYWRKLGDKVDAGVDLMISPAANPKQRTAVGTAGVKYDFRLATVRGQLDSTGKVSVLLEQKLTPAFGFLVAGELDHYKNTSKFGVGIMLESASEEMVQAEAAAQGLSPPL